MKCMECGAGRMRRQVARVKHEIHGIQFEVEGRASVCNRCGFQMIPADLLAEHGALVDRAYRKAAGLLDSTAIREARERLGMTQREFAEYLGVGEASVKRWEVGALPDKSSNDLIRLKTDPQYAQKSLEELCHKLGRVSPTEGEREVVFVPGPAGFLRPRAEWRTASGLLTESGTRVVFPETVHVN